MMKHCSLREPIDNPFKAGAFALPALNGLSIGSSEGRVIKFRHYLYI